MSSTLTPTTLTIDTVSADMILTGGTAFTTASDFVIAEPQEGKLLLVFAVTTAGVCTVGAGTYIGAGVGSMAVTLPINDTLFLVLSSSRFKTGTAGAGTINLTFDATAVGTLRLFYLP
ncbi:MAG: hypothetical protein IMZ53_00550 [Thermoplasmata archaeon]|nr:hypothetical protein [Thermoplasmata archaeon]